MIVLSYVSGQIQGIARVFRDKVLAELHLESENGIYKRLI
jgi:hypothetical protein